MVNPKGILVFIGLAFGVPFAITGTLRAFGLLPMIGQNLFQVLIVCALLFVPAMAAVIARRVEGTALAEVPAFWPVPWGQAVRIALVVFGLFTVQHALVALFGWVNPQWGLETVTVALHSEGVQVPSVVTALVPVLAYTLGTVLPLLLGMTLYAVLALGGEFGWRAYLLPRLDTLGPLRANIAVGLLWSLWWLPLVYFGFVDRGAAEPFAKFLPRYVLIMILLSMVSGQIMRRTGHVGLSAIFLGSVYAQWDGLWDYLFQLPVRPWAGAFGIVAAGVWLVAALLPGLFTSNRQDRAGEA